MTQIQLENGLYITDSTAEASAIVQADSTSQGFLPPRMTSAQRDAIVAPATGLMIFNTDEGTYNLYDGSSWTALGSNGIGDHGCFVYDNTVRTFASGNTLPLTFNFELKDTDGYHDTTYSNSRLTIPDGQAGTYQIVGNLAWQSYVDNSIRGLRIRLNGSDIIALADMAPNSGSSVLQVTTLYDLGKDDYVELVPVQNSGINLTIHVGSYSPTFRIQRIA